VNPWVIDHVGHMNVQFYTARFDEAAWQFLGRLGLTPSFLKRNRRAAVAADQRTEYKKEVLAGTLLHIATELMVIGTKSMRLMHRMYDSETNVEVAEMEVVGVYFDTDRRSPVEWPEIVRERADALRVTGEMVAQKFTRQQVPLPAHVTQGRASGGGTLYRPAARARSAVEKSNAD
jgi:acyl-CoA thioester hydrolase